MFCSVGLFIKNGTEVQGLIVYMQISQLDIWITKYC